MAKKIFVTGTDTDIGKTYVALGLLNQFKQQSLSTIAIKPLASGCESTAEGLRNADALKLQQHASIKLPYAEVNPIALSEPIAPYIAAKKQNLVLDVLTLKEKCQPALQRPADVYVIEGIGGWYQPLNAQESMADFVEHLNLEVLLVVGMRLGCLNHSLLTYHNIRQRRIKLCGWVANCIDPNMLFLQENIQILSEQIQAPLLAVVPFGGEVTLKYPFSHE